MPGSMVIRYVVFGRNPRGAFTVMRLRCHETFGEPPVRGEMRKS
jgi:hypothetical protein